MDTFFPLVDATSVTVLMSCNKVMSTVHFTFCCVVVCCVKIAHLCFARGCAKLALSSKLRVANTARVFMQVANEAYSQKIKYEHEPDMSLSCSMQK